jgi:hypothetical protein
MQPGGLLAPSAIKTIRGGAMSGTKGNRCKNARPATV